MKKIGFERETSHLHPFGASSAPGIRLGFPYFELSEVSSMIVIVGSLFKGENLTFLFRKRKVEELTKK